MESVGTMLTAKSRVTALDDGLNSCGLEHIFKIRFSINHLVRVIWLITFPCRIHCISVFFKKKTQLFINKICGITKEFLVLPPTIEPIIMVCELFWLQMGKLKCRAAVGVATFP